MRHLVQTASALAAAGALALALGGNALAEPSPSAAFGQHVRTCARAHLGQREGAPGVTCVHDGMTMEFATFGEMVRHMKEMHGG